MKNQIFLGALTLALSQVFTISANAGAVRLLRQIPACKGFEAVKKVNEADQMADSAMTDAKAAIKDIEALDSTCTKIAAASSYNSDTEIKKLTSESKIAARNSMSAVKSLDLAAKKAEPIMDSLGAIGAREKCVKEAKELPSRLLASKKEVEVAMKKVESCVNRAAMPSPPKKALPPCGPFNPGTPGVDCYDPGTSCMPGEKGCVDRGSSDDAPMKKY